MTARSTTLYALGGTMLVLGLVIALTGWYIFPVCEMEGKFVETKAGKLLPMPCGYTARAETGLGALVGLLGVGMIALPSFGSRRAFGLMAVGLGAVVLAVPTLLVGMCAAPDHICRVATQPALILLGGITMMGGLYLTLARDRTVP